MQMVRRSREEHKRRRLLTLSENIWLSSEVDAAALAFPVAVARRIGAFETAGLIALVGAGIVCNRCRSGPGSGQIVLSGKHSVGGETVVKWRPGVRGGLSLSVGMARLRWPLWLPGS